MFIYKFFVNRDYCQYGKFLIANQQGLLPLCLSTNFLTRVCCQCVNCLIANQQGLLPLCLSTNFENRVYCQCVKFFIANQQGLPYCPCGYLQISRTEFTVSVLNFSQRINKAYSPCVYLQILSTEFTESVLTFLFLFFPFLSPENNTLLHLLTTFKSLSTCL